MSIPAFESLQADAQPDLRATIKLLLGTDKDINVGEEFLAQFTVGVVSGHFQWSNVDMYVRPRTAIADLVPNGQGADPPDKYYAGGTVPPGITVGPYFLYHLGTVGSSPVLPQPGLIIKTLPVTRKVRFKAKSIVPIDSQPFACVELFSGSGKINISAHTTRCFTSLIGEAVLHCPVCGREFDPDDGYTHCPFDGALLV